MIDVSHALAVIDASRQGEAALVITVQRLIRETRHFLEDHGAAMEHVRFCTPDTLHLARGRQCAVVAVDSHARMQALERRRLPEFDDFITAVTAC